MLRSAFTASAILFGLAACGGAPGTTTDPLAAADAEPLDAVPVDASAAETLASSDGGDTASDLVADAAAKGPVTHLRGTAYTFNAPNPIVGATIRVAELPGLVTQTDQQGEYDLAIEVTVAVQKVTPYITMPEYHTIYLQTFSLHPGDADLAHVHFQTPDEGVFYALAKIVGVDPATKVCQVVSTVSDKVIQGMSFKEFAQHGAHGVGGVTAMATPTLAKPIYFNSKVIPDPKLTESSDDGGILWKNVPDGEYTLSASHPTRKFATIQVTCAPGRIVNANPPWGLHEIP